MTGDSVSEAADDPEKKLVFIVDDDQDFCELLCEILTEAGYECQFASHGVDALKRMGEEYTRSARDNPTRPPRLPHLILLDWLMPRMGGFGLMNVLMANPKYREIPVVIISNYELDIEDSSLPWVAYLPKIGLSPETLLDLVAKSIAPELNATESLERT